jgi:hypothetical protein
MTMTTTLRDRLADAKQRISGLRDERAAARADAQRAAEAMNPNDQASVARARQASEALRAVNQRLEAAQDEERYLLEQMAGTGRDLYGESFLRDPNALNDLARYAESSAPIGRVNLGVGVSRDDVVAQIGQFSAAAGESTIGFAGRGRTYVGAVEPPRRQLRLLDLIPSAPMDGRSIEYTHEVGSSLDAAGETAEGAIKPQHTADFEDQEAVARTIAHFSKLRKAQLADSPQLEGVVRNRLTYGVMRRLEGQVLAGDGTGENLRGILNTSGIASVAYDAAELAADQALEGLVAVLLSDATPNFIALNPRQWADMLKAKATGSGDYFSGGPFVATAERLWGAVAVPATGVPAGTALVGDATIGATIFVREGVSVIMSDSDQDDFIRNKVTLLGEGRFALAIWQPSAFAVVDLAA